MLQANTLADRVIDTTKNVLNLDQSLQPLVTEQENKVSDLQEMVSNASAMQTQMDQDCMYICIYVYNI